MASSNGRASEPRNIESLEKGELRTLIRVALEALNNQMLLHRSWLEDKARSSQWSTNRKVHQAVEGPRQEAQDLLNGREAEVDHAHGAATLAKQVATSARSSPKGLHKQGIYI